MRIATRSRSHLSAAVAASEKWLASNIAWLDVEHDESGLYPRRLKAVCEIAFLEHYAAARPSPLIRGALAPLLESLWTSGRLLLLWRYNLVHANLFIPLAAAAIQVISPTPAQLEDVRLLCRLAETHHKERLPFRTLDLLHALYKVTGDDRHYEELLEAASRGCLGNDRDLQDADPDDEHAFTHTVFCVTDYGKRPWPAGLSARPAIIRLLDVLSAKGERVRNLGLIAECALSRQMLDTPGARYERELRLLADNFLDGYWPAAAELSEALGDLRATETEMLFLTHYYTTIVAREALQRAIP